MKWINLWMHLFFYYYKDVIRGSWKRSSSAGAEGQIFLIGRRFCCIDVVCIGE